MWYVDEAAVVLIVVVDIEGFATTTYWMLEVMLWEQVSVSDVINSR